ncbi:MAG: histidine phosphatase family protein [Candidatus Diapherotrites archaeon]|nr:histidine phosphatase family protein [Candidatus Diapherotrites archaeon]
MVKIFLIRHGETTGDVENRYGGDFDDCLSEKGKLQAKALAEKLSGKGIEVIFHSPRKRAAETAKVIAAKLNVEMKVVDDLRERNQYGVLTGLVKSEAKAKFPKEVEKLSKHKYRNFVSGSEDYDFFAKRVIAAFKKISSEDYKKIAIITHGGPISTLARGLLNLGEFKILGDCSIMILEAKNGKYLLVSLQGAELEGK